MPKRRNDVPPAPPEPKKPCIEEDPSPRTDWSSYYIG